jgi:intracellular sulfur oxidation DsrE/DsrF family protein
VENSRTEQQIVILITRSGMGSADPDLQHKLLKTYLTLVREAGPPPSAFCFYGEGVKMVAAGSPVLDELRILEDQGVLLLVCGTCLDFYDLREQVQVGIVGGMPDIIEAQWRADKVVTL